MSDDQNQQPSKPRRRGLLWLIFVLPGTIILWWDYYFPGPDQVWASARRRDVPFFQVLYSLGFWCVVLIALALIIHAIVHG